MDLRLVSWAGKARSIYSTLSWRSPSRVVSSYDNLPCDNRLLIEGVHRQRQDGVREGRLDC